MAPTLKVGRVNSREGSSPSASAGGQWLFFLFPAGHPLFFDEVQMDLKKIEQRLAVERAAVRAMNELPARIRVATRAEALHLYRMVVAYLEDRGVIHSARMVPSGGVIRVGKEPTRGVIDIESMEMKG